MIDYFSKVKAIVVTAKNIISSLFGLIAGACLIFFLDYMITYLLQHWTDIFCIVFVIVGIILVRRCY
jgi:hypothetical protein